MSELNASDLVSEIVQNLYEIEETLENISPLTGCGYTAECFNKLAKKIEQAKRLAFSLASFFTLEENIKRLQLIRKKHESHQKQAPITRIKDEL
jgi:hypothetical protein